MSAEQTPLTMTQAELDAKILAATSAAKAEGEATGRTAGMTDTVARISAIDALAAQHPGYEHIVAENRLKPEMNADKVASLILAAQKAKTENVAAARSEDGAATAAAAAGQGGAPDTKEADTRKVVQSAMVKGMNGKTK